MHCAGGVCLGVPGPGCAWSGCWGRGVPSWRVPGPGDGIPACTEADPPVNRMTDRCKNITLPQTSFAGGNNQCKCCDEVVRTRETF